MTNSGESPTGYDDIYPNSPLSDVACEIRFVGEMQVECERHRFWDAIREDYPDILVPLPQPGQATALQHYRFRSKTGDRAVLVALNSLAYSEAQYSGHKQFLAEFLKLVASFRRCYPKLGSVTRIGWRYINLIPFTVEDDLLPLNRFLKFRADLPLGLFDRTGKIDLQWSGLHGEATATVRLANVARKDSPGNEALLLDIDFARENAKLSWDGIATVIEELHGAGREAFEQLITDGYRDYLRGNTL